MTDTINDLKEFAENCLEVHEHGSLEYRLASFYLETPRTTTVNLAELRERVEGLRKSRLSPNGEQICLANIEFNAALDAVIALIDGGE